MTPPNDPRAMYPTYPRCPSCGQAPAASTIWPDAQGQPFGTCADRFHSYPWLLDATERTA